MNEEKIYKIENIEDLEKEKNRTKKEVALHAFMAGAAGASLIAMHKIGKLDLGLLENILSHAMVLSIGGFGLFKLLESLSELDDIEDKEVFLNEIKSLNDNVEVRGKSL